MVSRRFLLISLFMLLFMVSVAFAEVEVNISKTTPRSEYNASQIITFTVNITNNGDSNWTNINVTDVYDPNFMRFLNATFPPNITDEVNGILTWINISQWANLNVTNSSTDTVFTNFSINFSAITNITNTTNTINATATNATDGNEANFTFGYNLTISEHIINITIRKENLSALNTTGVVQFRLLINNTGTVNFTTINITDTFNASILQFSASNLTPNATDNTLGSLIFDNITSTYGVLQPGQVAIVLVNFTFLTNRTVTNRIDTVILDNTGNSTSNETNVTIANIASPVVNISVNKTLLTQEVTNTTLLMQFSITINNTGQTNLTTINLTDNFNGTSMGFLAANLTPDTASNITGLFWGNITLNLTANGVLEPGEHIVIELNFTANQTSDVRQINNASVNGIDQFLNPTGIINDSVTYKITGQPNISINKTLESGSPANVSSLVRFLINITNTGDTNITNLTLNDTFRGGTLGFIASNLSVDNASNVSGTIHFPNVLSGQGDLTPGSQFLIEVNFTVLSSSSSLPGNVTNNTIITESVVDAHNKTVTYLNLNTGTVLNALNDSATVITQGFMNVSVVKTLESNASVNTSSIITYLINVTNRGSDNITIVSIIDSFNATELGFLQANITPTNASNQTIGTVFFPNITQGAALEANQSVAILLNFTAIISNISSNNTVQVNAFDLNNNNFTTNDTVTAPNVTGTSLAISDSGPVAAGTLVTFTANYLNRTSENFTSGTHIAGASCNLSLANTSIVNMSDTGTEYQVNLSLVDVGTLNYNVTCAQTQFNTLTQFSSIVITNVATSSQIFRGRGGGGGGGGGSRFRFACQDGIDNDGDGLIDLYDPDCRWATDDSEGDHIATTATPVEDTETRPAFGLIDTIRSFYNEDSTLSSFELLDRIRDFYEGLE